MDETDDPRVRTGRLDWGDVGELARSLPAKYNLVVPKTAVPEPPPYPTTRLGRPYGCQRQYRDGRARENLHIKEYDDRWVVHVDAFHPGKHVVRHLLVDRGYDRFVHLRQWMPHLVPPAVPADA